MANTMRAVAYRKPRPVSDPASLEDVELPVPRPGPRDLLVRVEAVSVNPVDVKLRASSDPGGQPRVLALRDDFLDTPHQNSRRTQLQSAQLRE